MKTTICYLSAAFLLLGCQKGNEGMTDQAFEINAATVLANLNGWQNENLDYSMYADNFVMLDTGFGAEKDSIGLDEMKQYDRQLWSNYDFKLLDNPPNLLPGVNPDTKIPDGSVRHYSSWEVTRPATDSTGAKSGIIQLYESFDFDSEGKIIFQQAFADFTGLMMYLNSPE